MRPQLNSGTLGGREHERGQGRRRTHNRILRASTLMKYCPNTNCRHRATSGSQAEYLDHVAACADCGAPLVAGPGSLVELLATSMQDGSAESDESPEDLRELQARLDVRTGVFGILAGVAITLGTIIFPTERGTSLVAWGPIAYGVFRLVRGLERKPKT